MNYNIISTGSQGNAVILNDLILIDCGVPFKSLKNVYKNIKLVLLTHSHGDHFKKTTIMRLAKERPSLRFGCGGWLAEKLIQCGINKANIDIFCDEKLYDYGTFKISPFRLFHDVPNCGYRVFFGSEKAIYATDTKHLDGISAQGYDLYMIEANYITAELQKKISEKQQRGEYTHEMNTADRHLSKEQADAFLLENMSANSKFVYLHRHKDRPERK